MKCKFCEAELEEGMKFCPSCGGAQEDTAQEQAPAAVEEPVVAEEAVVAEPVAMEEPANTSEKATSEADVQVPVQNKKPKVKAWQIIIGVFASVIVLAALAIVLLTAFGVDLRPKPNDLHKKDVYTVSDEKAQRAGNKVVATMGDKQLTNTMLQMFYRMAVVEYINSNAEYFSYLNLDVDKPLAEQTCYEDETLTWEQYFLNSALETWRNYQTVYTMAMEEGFKPSADLEHSLQDLPATMEEMAKEEGFENGDALIADRFGPGCTVADYEDYCRVYYVSAEYINITPTAQDLEDYYTNNQAMFEQYGIGKDSGNMVNVRHILVCPEGGVADPDTQQVTFSEEEWNKCYAKAEAIYNDWKAGEASEESFALLANEKSEDGGSNTNGGLYTGITKDTNFVPPFLEWCMDETRGVGDTGIVKTDYGYHIMYFAYTQPQWQYYAATYFQSEYTSDKIEEGRAKWPMDVTYKNIVLAELEIA